MGQEDTVIYEPKNYQCGTTIRFVTQQKSSFSPVRGKIYVDKTGLKSVLVNTWKP